MVFDLESFFFKLSWTDKRPNQESYHQPSINHNRQGSIWKIVKQKRTDKRWKPKERSLESNDLCHTLPNAFGISRVTIKDICDEYIRVNKEVYTPFIGLEKAPDRIDINVLYQDLRKYSIGDNFLKAVQIFLVRVGCVLRISEKWMSELFVIEIWLWQGYVISSWLFNLLMDIFVGEVNTRVWGKGWRCADDT